MKVEVEVREYSRENGVRLLWDDEANISVQSDTEIVVRCNRAGMSTLARHLLTLAQADVPVGAHIHLDQWSGLEEGSAGIVFDLVEG